MVCIWTGDGDFYYDYLFLRNSLMLYFFSAIFTNKVLSEFMLQTVNSCNKQSTNKKAFESWFYQEKTQDLKYFTVNLR